MSNSNQKKKAGYKCPPVDHQFSSTNQPKRRRGKAKAHQSHNLLQYLVDALAQTVPISKNGKRGEAALMAAICQQLANQAAQGTIAEKIKLFDYLTRSGAVDFLELKDRLEKEHQQEIENARREYDKLLDILRLEIDSIYELIECRKFATTAFFAAKERCSCGSFDDLQEEAECFIAWHAEDEEDLSETHESEDPNWSPGQSAKVTDEYFGEPADMDSDAGDSIPFNIHKSDQAENPDDPFYTGMIGND